MTVSPPALTVTGTAAGLFGNLSGGTALTETALYGTAVTFVSNVPADHVVVWDGRLERVPPVVAYFAPDGTLKRNGDPVKLLANDPGLNVTGLQWTCIINGIEEFTFDADGDVDLSSVVNVPNLAVVGTPFTEASIIALLANTSSPIREALDALYASSSVGDGTITFAKLAAALVVTSTETIAANNNNTTVPTSAAVIAYVATAFTNFIAGAPGALDTWLEVVAAIQSDESGLATLTTLINTKYTKPGPGIPSTDLTTAVQTSLGKADNALPTSAVVDNTDGTGNVGTVLFNEPLTAATAIVATATAPVMGKVTLYNAASGNLSVPLLALSGLRVGARFAVRRDPAEVSSNTLTFTLAGADTFYSSGATSFTLPIPGEQREFQVIQVGSTKYWTPAGSLNPITGLGRVFGQQNRGNIAVWFGDSIGTAGDQIIGSPNLVDTTIRSESTFTYASILSGQRLRYFRNCSKGGDNIASALARWTTDVAPYQFSVLVLALGTNDSFLQTTVANFAAAVKEIHARTRAKGAEMIVCTMPPNDNLSNNPSNRKSLIVQYNQFLRDYAALHGLILIDMFDLLSDTSGNYLPGMSTDKTHPVADGYYAMGQLVADTLAFYLPPFSAPLPRTTTDANLLAEPLFLGGLNGSFVPSGWSMPSGVLRTGVTASLVTTDTDIKGNWYKMVVANTFSGPQTMFQTVSSGITAGRIYRFLGRIKQVAPVGISITGRIAYDGNFDYTGTGAQTHEFRPMSGLSHAIPSGVFMFDSVAPASAATAQVNFQIVGNGGTGEVHLAQLGLYDITDNMGVLS